MDAANAAVSAAYKGAQDLENAAEDELFGSIASLCCVCVASAVSIGMVGGGSADDSDANDNDLTDDDPETDRSTTATQETDDDPETDRSTTAKQETDDDPDFDQLPMSVRADSGSKGFDQTNMIWQTQQAGIVTALGNQFGSIATSTAGMASARQTGLAQIAQALSSYFNNQAQIVDEGIEQTLQVVTSLNTASNDVASDMSAIVNSIGKN